MFVRLVVAILLIFPLGMLLGMGFPLGIRILEQDGPSMVPWVWGINGACSVLGSILAWGFALNFGYNMTIWTGIVIYMLGAITIATRSAAPLSESE